MRMKRWLAILLCLAMLIPAASAAADSGALAVASRPHHAEHHKLLPALPDGERTEDGAASTLPDGERTEDGKRLPGAAEQPDDAASTLPDGERTEDDAASTLPDGERTEDDAASTLPDGERSEDDAASALPDAADADQSVVLEIGDIVLEVDGEQFPIDAEAAMAMRSTPDDIYVQFEARAGERAVFPMQFQRNREGIAVQIGESDTVYFFTASFFESAAMGVGSFAEQFEAIVEDPAASDAEFDASAVVSDLCAALEANGVQADEAELDGEAAARWAFDFTTGETVALAQALSESLRESGAYAYLGLDDMEAELASLPAVAIELGLEGELTCAESGAVALEGVMDFGGDVGRMPFSLAWDGADAGSLSLQLISGDLPSMEGQINADGEAWEILYREPGMDARVQLLLTTAADGADQLDMRVEVDAGAPALMNVISDFDTIYDVDIDVSGRSGPALTDDAVMDIDATVTLPGGAQVGGSCRIRTGVAPVTGSLDSEGAVVIDSDEALLADGAGLMLSALGMAGDVEKLMAADGVAEFIEALEAGDMSARVGVTYDFGPDAVGTPVDPEALSFTVPDFTVLPDGYALDELRAHIAEWDDGVRADVLAATFYSETGSIFVHFERYAETGSALAASDPSYVMRDGEIVPGGDEVPKTYAIIDGELVVPDEADRRVEITHIDEEAGMANWYADGIDVMVTWMDAGLDDEDILAMIAGIEGLEIKPDSGAARADARATAFEERL